MAGEGGTGDTVVIRGVSGDEEGRKRASKVEVGTHSPESLRHFEKKMMDKGLQRMERHPVDGRGLGRPPPKSGRGGKYTWEGPEGMESAELDPAPAALDERDPNYVEEEEEEEGVRGGEEEGRVVGEVEVAKVAEEREGVARVEVAPPLQP